MPAKQKLIIWFASVMMAAMAIYPPWVHVARWHERRYAYGWIFNPPAGPTRIVEEHDRRDDWFPNSVSKRTESEPGWRTELDFARLFTQWAAACLIGGALYFGWPKSHFRIKHITGEQVDTIAAIIFSAGAAAFFIWKLLADIRKGNWIVWVVLGVLMAGGMLSNMLEEVLDMYRDRVALGQLTGQETETAEGLDRSQDQQSDRR